MARVAHAMAIESGRVTADVVEIQEFPALAQAYGVRGVPMTVVNGSVAFSGAVTEEEFLSHLLEAVSEQKDGGEDQDADGG